MPIDGDGRVMNEEVELMNELGREEIGSREHLQWSPNYRAVK